MRFNDKMFVSWGVIPLNPSAVPDRAPASGASEPLATLSIIIGAATTTVVPIVQAYPLYNSEALNVSLTPIDFTWRLSNPVDAVTPPTTTTAAEAAATDHLLTPSQQQARKNQGPPVMAVLEDDAAASPTVPASADGTGVVEVINSNFTGSTNDLFDAAREIPTAPAAVLVTQSMRIDADKIEAVPVTERMLFDAARAAATLVTQSMILGAAKTAGVPVTESMLLDAARAAATLVTENINSGASVSPAAGDTDVAEAAAVLVIQSTKDRAEGIPVTDSLLFDATRNAAALVAQSMILDAARTAGLSVTESMLLDAAGNAATLVTQSMMPSSSEDEAVPLTLSMIIDAARTVAVPCVESLLTAEAEARSILSRQQQKTRKEQGPPLIATLVATESEAAEAFAATEGDALAPGAGATTVALANATGEEGADGVDLTAARATEREAHSSSEAVVTLPVQPPTINFVWIGQPRFNHGGQDIIGPQTFDANFKKFGDKSSQNPMVFWCQNEHKAQYVEYFAAKGINISVKAIESSFSDTTTPHAAELSKRYHELMAKESSTSLYRVFFKDMFFKYLLATEGGYVMDTGMYAHTSHPVTCKAYDTVKFPLVGDDPASLFPELWALYAPEKSPEANMFLQMHFDEYTRNIDRSSADEISLNKIIGEIGTDPYIKFINDLNSAGQQWSHYTWGCSGVDISTIPLDECGLTKLYFNSHRDKSLSNFNKLFCALGSGSIIPLKLLIEHTPPEEMRVMVSEDIGPASCSFTMAQVMHRMILSSDLSPEFREPLSSLLADYSLPRVDTDHNPVADIFAKRLIEKIKCYAQNTDTAGPSLVTPPSDPILKSLRLLSAYLPDFESIADERVGTVTPAAAGIEVLAAGGEASPADARQKSPPPIIAKPDEVHNPLNLPLSDSLVPGALHAAAAAAEAEAAEPGALLARQEMQRRVVGGPPIVAIPEEEEDEPVLSATAAAAVPVTDSLVRGTVEVAAAATQSKALEAAMVLAIELFSRINESITKGGADLSLAMVEVEHLLTTLKGIEQALPKKAEKSEFKKMYTDLMKQSRGLIDEQIDIVGKKIDSLKP